MSVPYDSLRVAVATPEEVAKIVVYDNNIGQVVTQDSFLQLLFMINRRLIFLLKQKWKTFLLFFQFDKTVCRLFCVKSFKFFGWLFTFLLLIFFHLYSFRHETFYLIEIFSLLPSSSLYFTYFYPTIRFMLL